MKHFLQFFDPETTPIELVQSEYSSFIGSSEPLEFETRDSGKLNKTNRARVRMIKGCKCSICGLEYGPVLQIHHNVPVSDGGSNDIRNLVVLCANCHQAVHCTIKSRDFVSARKMYTVEQYRRFKKIVNYKNESQKVTKEVL